MDTIVFARLKVAVSRRHVVVAAVLLVNLIAPSQAHAAEIQWNGGFNQSWHQVFNWDPFGSPFSIRRIPTDIDTANLLTPAGDDVFLFGDTEPINGLIVSNGIELFTNDFLLEVDNAGSATASVAGGATLHVEPRVGGGNALETDNLFLTGGGILDLDGGNALVQGNTTIFGDSQIIGSGSGSISFGGDVSVIDSSVLRLLGATTASFAPGTTVSAESSSIIDLEQTLNVTGGVTFEFTTSARMEATTLNIGNDGAGNGSDGTFILDKAGGAGLLPRIDVSQNLTIGDDSTGTALMRVTEAQTSVVGTTTIRATGTLQLEGSHLGANGVLVDGGTITTTNKNDPIFLFGADTLSVINGGLVDIDGDQTLDNNETFEFLSGSDLIVTGSLTVGTPPFGTGTLEVHGNGTTIDVGAGLVIGDNDFGFPGTATFGSGAVVGASNVQVGSIGPGTLTIESGAVLTSDSGRVGRNAGVMGTATITGTGSTWNVTSSLTVGSSGSGQLTIEAGGQVTSATGILGADSSATGTVTVTGAGSDWTVTGSLYLGGGTLGDLDGTGTLNVSPGGSVSAGNQITLFTNGLLNLAGGTLTTPTFDFQGGQFQWTSGTLHVQDFPKNLVNQGGTLAPGESAGSTTITGNYTQQAGAALEIEIGGTSPGGTYDLVSVTGSAILDGELQLALIDGFVPDPNDTFTVLNALDGIAGVFSNVTTGQRLDTLDGLGSFVVQYGAGSPFLNQIVLSAFELAPSFSADFDDDGDVDNDDLTIWEAAYGAGALADADEDGDSDGEDFLQWQQQFGSGVDPLAAAQVVPEPSSFLLLCLAANALVLWRQTKLRDLEANVPETT